MTAAEVRAPATPEAPAAAGARRRRRARRRASAGVRIAQLVILLGALAVWEFGSGNKFEESVLFDEFYTSRPSAIIAKFWEWLTDGTFIHHGSATLQETLVGWVLGSVLGIAVGFLLGVSERANRVLNPFVVAAYAVPRLALTPLFVLWFGLGMTSKVVLVAVIVFFLVFFSTLGGVREVDDELKDVVRVMGAKRWQVHAKVTMPSALSWVIAALHVTVPYAFVGAVVGEMLAGGRGLGFLMSQASNTFRPDLLFAAVTALVMMAIALNALVTWAERRLLRWRLSEQRRLTGVGV